MPQPFITQSKSTRQAICNLHVQTSKQNYREMLANLESHIRAPVLQALIQLNSLGR